MECIKKNDQEIIKKYTKGKFLGKVIICQIWFSTFVSKLGWLCKSLLIHKYGIKINLCS